MCPVARGLHRLDTDGGANTAFVCDLPSGLDVQYPGRQAAVPRHHVDFNTHIRSSGFNVARLSYFLKETTSCMTLAGAPNLSRCWLATAVYDRTNKCFSKHPPHGKTHSCLHTFVLDAWRFAPAGASPNGSSCAPSSLQDLLPWGKRVVLIRASVRRCVVGCPFFLTAAGGGV